MVNCKGILINHFVPATVHSPLVRRCVLDPALRPVASYYRAQSHSRCRQCPAQRPFDLQLQ